MTTLSLTEAPDVLPDASRTHWLTDDTTDVRIGDLWLLSWSREALVMVAITKVIDDYVLVCPVTLPTDPSFAPAVIRDDTPLGLPLTIWPSMETGLGKHLLRRNLGSFLSERTITQLRRYAEDGDESPLPIAEGDYYSDGNPEFFTDLLAYMQGLCFHEWPAGGAEDAVLSAEVLTQHEADIAFMTRTLGVAVPRARQLLRQEVVPTAAEVEALASAWGVPSDALLAAARDSAAETLLEPLFKPVLDQIMAKHGYDESTARRRAQEEYALAARTAQPSDRIARMTAALTRVLDGNGAT
jgi:hypothetical protein